MQHGRFWQSLPLVVHSGRRRLVPVSAGQLSQMDLLVRVAVSVQGSTGGEEWAVARDGRRNCPWRPPAGGLRGDQWLGNAPVGIVECRGDGLAGLPGRGRELFRSVGLSVATNERVEGVRTLHYVDVVVRSEQAGIEQLWLVECKKWNRPISKDTVLTLRTS